MTKQTDRSIVRYSLAKGESKDLTIVAAEFYSAEKIVVAKGQQYTITVAEGARWTDWFIKADPVKGYLNVLAKLWGMRVKGAKCFTLCAAFNDNEDGVFKVQVNQVIPMPPEDEGTLSFFANDTKGFYGNNKGEIRINVKRLT